MASQIGRKWSNDFFPFNLVQHYKFNCPLFSSKLHFEAHRPDETNVENRICNGRESYSDIILKGFHIQFHFILHIIIFIPMKRLFSFHFQFLNRWKKKYVVSFYHIWLFKRKWIAHQMCNIFTPWNFWQFICQQSNTENLPK